MKKFKLLGDPHLGRSFIHGVPLARRGEREAWVWNQFEAELDFTGHQVQYHVNMGDLFDKAIVSYDVIMKAADLYNTAAKRHPNVTFIILKGNHDLLRDLDRKSAFDLFCGLVTEPNVLIVTSWRVIDNMVFFAYDPINKAVDVVEKWFMSDTLDSWSKVDTAFGHWDTNGFGSDHNVVPTKQLALHGIKTVYTGHVHKPETFVRDDVTVHVVGSMQPYAFGEQGDDKIYVEHTLESLKTATDLKNKVVRINLEADETFDGEIDCLQVVIKKKSKDGEDEGPVVTIGDFDMETLFRKAFTEAGVSANITEKLLGSYNDRRLSTSE